MIIGFDILLKEDLKPVLLEVNCNPSLRIDFESETPDGQIKTLPSPIDVEIKKPLVLETLRLACPKKKLEQIERLKKEEEQVQRSALYRQNLVKHRIEQRSLSSIQSKKINFNKMPLLSKPSESYIKKLKASTSNTPDLKSNLNQTESSGSTTSILTSNFMNSSSTIISSNNSSSKTSQCLRNIFPNNNLRRQYNHLFIQDNIADLFIFFTMYNNYKLMTHGEFRLFVKSCNISNRQLSSDNLDIIFYDLSKKWDMYNTKKRFYDEEQNPIIGLCYQGFVECFIKLSRLIFTNEQTLEQCVRSFISYCKIILLQKGFKTSQFYSLDLNKIENNFLFNKLDNLKLRLIKRNEYQTSDFESPTNLLKTKKSIFPIFFDTMA
ncbi:unnamed protein product [Brachionus calyciflorus]|uniref:Uncharacterized protein n=1 Tax=Brachionus calyciflorus TaxID=104777 RepID=A0A813UR81_9BILA|nr:unnamed protein product [Brachionus calyciflorus]